MFIDNPLETCPADKDLLFMKRQVQIKISVQDVVYELLGEISSDSESDQEDIDIQLERFLAVNSCNSESQIMAKMKQTVRKRPPPATSHESEEGTSRRRNRMRIEEDEPPAEAQAEPTAADPEAEPPVDDPGEEPPTAEQPRLTTSGGKPGNKLAVSKKTSKKVSWKSQQEMSMRELTADWNRRAWIGLKSEILQGWLKTTKKTRDGQAKTLRRAAPGVKALHKIRHYQRCQQFLIAVLPFQHLVREITCNVSAIGDAIRWQSTALFAIQSSAEAYMSGYFHDVLLCALHQKVKTINRQDIWLAIQLCGEIMWEEKPSSLM